MTLRQLRRFLDLIPEIRAQERMEEAAVALMPHLTPAGRRDLVRTWKAQAFPQQQERSPKSHDQAWDSLRRMVRR